MRNPLSSDIALIRVAAAVIVVAWLWQSGPPAAHAESALPGGGRPVVVIDPGHGGHDTGARGLAGTTEKALTLKIARMLAAELAKTSRVVLTRRDDYELGIADRTAVANHHQAAVFIVLHTGASFSRQVAGNAVYHYRPFARTPNDRRAAPERSRSASDAPVRWQNAQLSHQKSSERLARLICDHLREPLPQAACAVYDAPLLTLAGAAMPAIMIELGYLTNPSEEKRMTTTQHQTILVKAVGDAIRVFLADTPSP